MQLDSMWQALLLVAAGLTTLIGAGSAIMKLFNPYKQILKRLDTLEAEQRRHAELLARDLCRFEANDERDRMMMEALFTLVEHARTDNSTGLMDETSRKMQVYLIHQK